MIIIRKLLPMEYPAYAAHLKRLDHVDRASRFHASVSDKTIDAHVDAMGWADSMVIGAFVDDGLAAAAELHGQRRDWYHGAEIAVTVESRFQGQGLGTEVVRRAVTVARNRSMRCVTMICLADNNRMRRIARHLRCTFVDEEGALAVAIDVGWPSPQSLLQEMVDDGLSMAMVSLGSWHRALRAVA